MQLKKGAVEKMKKGNMKLNTILFKSKCYLILKINTHTIKKKLSKISYS